MIHSLNRYHNYEINKNEVIHIFDNKKYITCGVDEKIPPLLQVIMWELINQMPVDKDYLQVFSLSCENGKQRIKHSQEEPEYENEYVFDTGTAITEKIFVIDDVAHSTMLLASEY